MDADQITFLFGSLPPGTDPDDPAGRPALLARAHPELAPGRLTVLTALATQIAQDEPVAVWATVQRLLAAGRTRDDVLGQLVLTFAPYAVADDGVFDQERYVAALGRLPLPPVAASRAALVAAAAARRVATVEELITDAADQLGASADDSGVEALLDELLEDLMHRDGPLEMLAGDVVVHVDALTDGLVLTHRLTPYELALGTLTDEADLAGFRRRDDVWELALPQLDAADVPADEPAEVLVAVRVLAGVATVEVLTEQPPVDPALVARLRADYDAAVDEPGLPVPIEELVLTAIVDEPSTWRAPAAPLRLLLAAAGLEIRGQLVAHDPAVWRRGALLDSLRRLEDQFGPGEQLDTIYSVLGALDGDLDETTARGVLDDLGDPEMLEAVTGALLGHHDDPDQVADTGRLGAQLLAAAVKPGQKARARWLLAVAAEREGRLAEAEDHLREAVRLDPDGPECADRLAWYRFDRGDADGARGLWRSLGATADESDDLRALDALPAAPAVTTGRNEPCWCGSGRKFKQCHLGRPEPLPLPDRVGWLSRKAAGFLERRGGTAREVVIDHLVTRAVDPDDDDSVMQAVSDPLVIDVVLHESGWFETFLAERGALLPADEAALAQAWTLVDRTVYEITEVRPGVGVTVRNLRTDEVREVRERSLTSAARTGLLVCGRAVPDGESYQFVGGLFVVGPGTEGELLELLDTGDGPALLAYVADLQRLPASS